MLLVTRSGSVEGIGKWVSAKFNKKMLGKQVQGQVSKEFQKHVLHPNWVPAIKCHVLKLNLSLMLFPSFIKKSNVLRSDSKPSVQIKPTYETSS